jgi:hypothetical protein
MLVSSVGLVAPRSQPPLAGTLAEMVGSTRSRVNLFMNKFKRLVAKPVRARSASLKLHINSWFSAEKRPITILSRRVAILRLPTRSLHNLLHR